MAQDNMYLEAMEAAREGKRARARDLLTRLIRANQSNVDYWLGMSAVVDSQKEQIYCLEKALEVEPDNDVAKRGLVLMGGRPADDNIVPVTPKRKREWDIGAIGSGKDGKDQKETSIPVKRLLTLGGVAIAAFGLIYFGVFGNPLVLPQSGNSGGVMITTPRLGGTAGPTPTFIGGGPNLQDTPLATFVGPTPLSLLLDVPYTATPRYVNTPHPSTAAYRSAMTAFDQSNWESAIEFLGQAIEIDPGAPDLRYHLGIAYLNLEDFFEAKKVFVQAANLDSKFGAAYFGMALADLGLGLEGDLVDELNDAIINDPDLGAAFVQRGIFRLSRGNADGALADLRRAEEQSPNSALLYLTLAKVFLFLERYDDALAAAQRSLEIDITIVETYWLLSQAHFALGQSRQVISPLQTYIQFEEENADAWFMLGQVLITERFYDNALAALEEALALEDTMGEVNYYRGLAYLELQDYENALKYLGNSSDNFPTWFEPHVALGRAWLETGEDAEGYTIIQASTGLAKTPQQLAVLYYWRALALEAVDEDEIALRDWELLLMLSTDVVPRERETLARSRLNDAGIAIPSRTPPAPTSTPTITPTPTNTPTPTSTPQ